MVKSEWNERDKIAETPEYRVSRQLFSCIEYRY